MTNRHDETEAERAERVADRLHSAAIHLLRAVRREDDAAGVTAPHLSALSVLVFGGARTLGELAAAEQVTPPSMTRIVRNLEEAGLAERETDESDRRVSRVRATEEGREVLLEGRRRRVASLAARVGALDDGEMAALESAAAIIERMLGR
ncbi:MAG TPA: MarR family transcriptional regulator [Longimicrobium sp.]|nr:MarR family transcriptional regulator [Longimicrobium sp.]